MLSNLDNEVVFKKAFTDKIVFQCFVKDILGLDIQVGKIHVSKQSNTKTGTALLQVYTIIEDNFIEIQLELPLEYWLKFATRLRYKKQPDFGAEHSKRTHYFIRIISEPYSSNLSEPVLISPCQNKVQLNPNYQNPKTLKPIQAWLDLIYQSMHVPENAAVNLQNKGIQRAVERLNRAHLTIKQRTDAKNIEQSKSALAHWQQVAVWKQQVRCVKRLHAMGKTVEEITSLMQLAPEAVQEMIDLTSENDRKPFF